MAVITKNGYVIGSSFANDGILTIRKNNEVIATFSANSASNVYADIAVPTKTSDLLNDSGFITSANVPTALSELSDDATHRLVTDTQISTWNSKSSVVANPQSTTGTLNAIEIDGVSYAIQGGGGAVTSVNGQTGAVTLTASDVGALPDTTSIPTESTVSGWGFTKNIGTVTQVKVGTTAYNPSSGIVSLPAYPTSLPASDVYAWAKAATKPSYTASEVGAIANATTINQNSLRVTNSTALNCNTECNIFGYYNTNGPSTSLFASSDGTLIAQAHNTSWVNQIAQDYRSGRLAVRSKNNGTWQAWKLIPYSSEIPTNTNQLTNGAGFITSSGSCASATKATQDADGQDIRQRYVNVYNTADIGGSSAVTFTNLAAAGNSVGMIYPATDNPTGSAQWVHALSLCWSKGSSANWVSQIALGVNAGTGMWYRTTSGNIAGRAWTRLIDSSNIGSQSVNYATSAGNADTVDGVHASVSAVASTAVVRDGNNYIYGTFFNSSIGDDNINNYSGTTVMFSGSDKWIRRTTKAGLQGWLGLGSSAYKTVLHGYVGGVNVNGAVTVTFASAFPAAPTVVCSYGTTGANAAGGWGALKVYDISASGFKVVIGGSVPTFTTVVEWVAFYG